MVETGSRRSLHGPAAIAVFPVLAVTGVVADGSRGDAGRTFRTTDAAVSG